VIEILFFFIMLLVVAILSRLIGRLPISSQMIFIVAGMVIGWLVTGYVDFQPPILPSSFLIAETALVLVLFKQ
jgi:sodium/hydrogen antiporter